jgi:hypothetical protein
MQTNQMTDIHFNINNNVRFKLTKHGRQYLAKLNRSDKVLYKYPLKFKTDKDGYCRDQLWHLMHIFGPALFLGSNEPIKMEIILEKP